jgi:hypothetical protein
MVAMYRLTVAGFLPLFTSCSMKARVVSVQRCPCLTNRVLPLSPCFPIDAAATGFFSVLSRRQSPSRKILELISARLQLAALSVCAIMILGTHLGVGLISVPRVPVETQCFSRAPRMPSS